MSSTLARPAWPAALLALALAACGGGGSSDPSTSTSDDAALAAAVAPAAETGDTAVARVQALAVQPAPNPNPAPRADVEPLGAVGVPDVNELGLLDRTGPNATAWPQVTQASRKLQLRQLGKAFFWDMQVGGDGVQACASCHFHAGADNRVVHQFNPGHASGDTVLDIDVLNARLSRGHYTSMANGVVFDAGFAVDEPSHIQLGATADAPDGTPGRPASQKPHPMVDVNDVASSQGVRPGRFLGVSGGRVDLATLAPTDSLFGFVFTAPAPGIPATTRRVAPRNTPSVVNAVYNLRNFWDGRADMFFNGVNTMGFRDPTAQVKTYAAGALGQERLLVPFSSLASQAIGPLLSDFEMTFAGRNHRDIGRKLLAASVVPLAGQLVAADDSLLGTLAATGGRGLNTGYAAMIRNTFHPRFWGDGNGGDVCLDANGAFISTAAAGACPTTSAYTLMQWNFALFFGLAVQAYEASLTSTQTIVDLIAGGVATGTITNGTRKVDVATMALPGCIVSLALDGSAAQQTLATQLCTAHYAKFIHPNAVTGSESESAPNPVPVGSPIGGCTSAPNCTVPSDRLPAAQATLNNVSLGMNRFFAGATSCAECHMNPEFTSATVSTLTGFGAKLPPLPNGQLRKELVQKPILERMIAGNGALAIYDIGFYNIGVRPTTEDLSLGAAIDGVPLSIAKLMEVTVGGSAAGLDAARIAAIKSTTLPLAKLPTAPNDLTPKALNLTVGCGAGNADGTTSPNCNGLSAGERLIRHGAFKVPGLRNVKFTGPYMHNGSKATLRQVLEFYKLGGHFRTLNNNNMDAGLRVISIPVAEEAAILELLETGLTDWRVAHQQGPFDHPELCVAHGHDATTGRSRIAGLPAVGRGGSPRRIATFEEMMDGGFAATRANTLQDGCTVPGVSASTVAVGNSLIDVPPTTATTTTTSPTGPGKGK